tara:strand:+ start:930 stop:2957 length:2028 start_codon:yes stop_codon:yes gene_type:complete
MKKITLLLLFLTICFSAKAQFPEGFETAVPPTNWVSFIGTNGEGTTQDWTTTTTAASGAQAAKVRYENVANAAIDWLVTPQFTPTPNANILTFKQRQDFGTDYGTTYTIRVSTASQTAHADFTIIDTQGETDFGTSYTTHNVDLSAYDNVPIYVAFVMEQDDGDSWFIDDVDVVFDASAPNCATDPTPAVAATGVAINGGSVTLSWVAPTTGDPATDYEIFWGTTTGSLTSLGTTSALTVDITNIDFSTPYFWMIVPQNVGGSATGCAEWSFTTEAAPPAPDNDLPAGAIALTVDEGLACGANGITGISNQSTTDSGVTAPSCGSYGTPTERGDLWYTIVAPSTGEVTFDVNNLTVMTSVAGAFYSGTVGSLVEESCTEFGTGWPWLVSGLTAGDTYYVRVWDYGNDQTGTFDLCAFYPAPIVPNYTNDFTSYPGDGWSEASGAFMSPTGTSSSFTSDDFGNDTGHANGQSARINIFGTTTDEYLISPAFNLSGSTYYLNFDIAYTEFSGTAAATMGADDFVALLVTEDGTTWTELTRWDTNSTISNTGESVGEMTLTGYGADVKFAFYAFSDTANEDNNFYIDNFNVTTTTLGVDDNTLEGFTLFPTLVKEELRFTSQNAVDQITVFSLLGQKVFSSSPNVANSQVNLASLRAGIYIVKVKVGSATATYKIIKE